MHVTDRQTDDGQNYNPEDCASIAASRGKNGWSTICCFLLILLSSVLFFYLILNGMLSNVSQ